MRSSPRMARRVFLSVMSWAKRIVLGVELRQRHRALEKNEKLRQGTDGLRETALYQIGPGEERGGYAPIPCVITPNLPSAFLICFASLIAAPL